MKLNLTVTHNDGAVAEVIVSAPDFVAFERTFDRSVARFESEIKFTDICWLAWHKLNRAGNVGDFEQWLETIDGVSIGEPEDFVPLEKTVPTS